MPNQFRLATVWKCFDELAVLCGANYGGLFDTLRAELLRAVYAEGWEPLRHGGVGARAYAHCVPYFDALEAEKVRLRSLERAHAHWQQEQVGAPESIEAPSPLVNASLQAVTRYGAPLCTLQIRTMESIEARRTSLEGGISEIQASLKNLVIASELASERQV